MFKSNLTFLHDVVEGLHGHSRSQVKLLGFVASVVLFCIYRCLPSAKNKIPF